MVTKSFLIAFISVIVSMFISVALPTVFSSGNVILICIATVIVLTILICGGMIVFNIFKELKK